MSISGRQLRAERLGGRAGSGVLAGVWVPQRQALVGLRNARDVQALRPRVHVAADPRGAVLHTAAGRVLPAR